jgi:hypothetical protein
MAALAILLMATVALRQTPAAEDKKPGEARRLELNDNGKLVSLSNPQLSPNGKSVAVLVGQPN